MARSNILYLLALTALLNLARAAIPSLGLTTAEGVRSDLADSEFRIRFNRGTQINTPAFDASIADLTNFPALAGADVQSTLVRVTVRAGETFFAHFHPRATETLNAVRGTFRISFRFEGAGDPRIVTNVIRAGESTVFPQGLIHETVCISDIDCRFVAVLNSADPGTIPAAL